MGEKKTEIIRFNTPCGRELFFPVATVTGNNPGPAAVITAGVHGCEYPGIVSAIRLFKELTPEEVNGSVKIVTITSTAAFEERSMFVTPYDKVNPNRVFPGRADGSYSEVLTYRAMELIAGADYHMDLHGGDMVEDLDPFSIYHRGDSKELNDLSYEITHYYGLPNVVVTEKGGLWPDDGTTYANVSERLHIPSAIVEVGAMGVLDEPSVQKHLFGLKNVLRKFGTLKGEVSPVTPPEIFENMAWVYTGQKGIFYMNVKVGDYVKKGDTIGVLEDYFGNYLETVASPVDGKALFLTGNPAMKEHGLVAGIGVSEK